MRMADRAKPMGEASNMIVGMPDGNAIRATKKVCLLMTELYK